MQKIKLFILSLATVFSMGLSVASVAAPVFAQEAVNNNFSIDCNEIRSQGGIDPACTANIGRLLSRVVIIIFIVAALLAFLFLIIGGIRWILSGGDKEGTTKARSMITAAIIGLAIVFLAFVVINILGAIFGFNINNLKIPSLANIRN